MSTVPGLGPKHDPIRFAARWFSGRPISGRPRTDATFLRRGTRAVGVRPPGRWSYMPEWRRSAIRQAVVLAVVLAVVGEIAAPRLAHIAEGIAALAGGVYGTVKAYRAWRHRQHVNTYVEPLHAAMAAALALPDDRRHQEYIEIPRDVWTSENAKVRITLPPDFLGGPDVESRLHGLVRAKLGLSDTTVTYSLVGRPTMTLRQAPRPPGKVSFDDVLQLLEAQPESAPLMGLGHRSRPVAVDLDSESPHVLISAGSGGGKSVMTRCIAAQVLHNGGQVVFLDVKRTSHLWARGLPRVEYWRTPEEIHHSLIALGQEVDRRYSVIEDQGEGADVGPRILIVAEELNAMMGRIRKYWETAREKEDPKTSPAVEAFLDILFMGRAGLMHILGIGQMITAKTVGGPEGRENFGTRCMARYTLNAWKMLVPEIWPPPKPTRHTGRIQVCLGGVATETQVPFFTAAEARGWAASHRHTVTVPGEERHSVTDLPRPALSVVPDPPAPPTRYTLAEAARQGIVTVSYDVLRAAKSRDPEFPGGKEGGPKYTVEELQTWERNRPRSVRRTTG